MSSWRPSPSTPRASSRTRSIGTPPVPLRPSPSHSGPARAATRSASKRSLPAETGVWIVKTLLARVRSRASSRATPFSTQGAGTLHEQERGVAFVEVPDGRLDAQGLDGAHAAHAQDQLLVEAHLAAADVEDVGDRPVRLVVVGDVRIEQQDRHAADLDAPDGGREHPLRQLDVDDEGIALRIDDTQDREPRQVVVGVGVLLVARSASDPSGGSSRACRGSPTPTNGRAMSLAVLMWSPASTPSSAGSRCRRSRGSRTRRRSRQSGP